MKLTFGATQMAVSPISEVPRPTSAQIRQRAPVHRIPEAPKPVRPTSETQTPVLATNPTAGFREIVSGLRALSATTTIEGPRTSRGFDQSKTVEPPSPRALQIRSTVKQQAANATEVVKGSVVEGGDKAKDYGPKEICRSISDEELSNLLLYRPAQHPTWKFKGEHANLFEVMASRNAMIKVNMNDSELFIFSSMLLDKTSQFLINKQKKTENFLWGFFLDNGDIVDMDLDIKYPTPSVSLKLTAESQSTLSTSPEKGDSKVSLPPGFEKLWLPTLVKLNIQGSSNPVSNVYGCAGLTIGEVGVWLH